jgi:hypothetical protein
MKWDVTILSTNEYKPEEIVGEEIPDKYLFNDQEEFLLTSTIMNSEETIYQLIDFLFNFFFQSSEPIPEVYRDNNNYVLDLSSIRERLIDFDYLEEFYPKWIEETARKNTMDEYGMLLDFIGHARKGVNMKYLLIIVSGRWGNLLF